MIGTPAVRQLRKNGAAAFLHQRVHDVFQLSASGRVAKDQRAELATVQDPTTVEDRLAKGRDNGGEPRAAFCYHLSTHCIRCYNRNAMLLEHAAHGRFASANPACQTIHCHTIGSFVDLYSSLLRCHTRLWAPPAGLWYIPRTAADDSQWREDECSPSQTLATLLLQSGR